MSFRMINWRKFLKPTALRCTVKLEQMWMIWAGLFKARLLAQDWWEFWFQFFVTFPWGFLLSLLATQFWVNRLSNNSAQFPRWDAPAGNIMSISSKQLSTQRWWTTMIPRRRELAIYTSDTQVKTSLILVTFHSRQKQKGTLNNRACLREASANKEVLIKELS